MLVFYIGFGIFCLLFMIVRPFILIVTGMQKNQPARVKRGKKMLMQNSIVLVVLLAIGLVVYYLVWYSK